MRTAAADFMVRFNLLSADAFHTAVCSVHGIGAIAGADKDFERADGFVYYTCNEDLVGPDLSH